METRTNSLGFRGPELAARPLKRVFVIGDSVVANSGVEFEKIFTTRLQRRLGRPEETEIVNAGLSDSGVDEYLSVLEHRILPLNPDVIVVGLYLNDSRPPQGFFNERTVEPWERFFTGGLLEGMVSARIIHQSIRSYRISNEPALLKRFRWVPRYRTRRFLHEREEWESLVGEADLDWGAGWSAAGWGEIEKRIVRMKALCDKAGVLLAIAVFPVAPQVEIELPFPGLDYPQMAARRLADAAGLQLLDTLPALRARRGERLFFDQCHLTATGNEVRADTFAPFVVGLLGEPPAGAKGSE